MSQGSFTTSRYGSETLGTQHPIRVQPETLDITLGGTANTPPVGTSILPSAQVSRSRRALGINARTITFKFASGNEPTGYKPESPITVPWLQNNTAFLSAVPGETVVNAYGSPAILVGTTPEKVR